jgi:hydrogenase nickel incorporation protein HypA/HybF
MHELSLMQDLLATAERYIAKNHVTRVNCVNVSVGRLANVLPDALSFAFEALTQEGVLKGAHLDIEFLPAVAACSDCGHTYETDGLPLVCPVCRSPRFTIVGGEEVYLQSIECEVA